MEEKKVIVNVSDLAALHNQLCVLHPTGDDIIGVANCIVKTRQIVDNSPEYEAPKEKDEPKKKGE